MEFDIVVFTQEELSAAVMQGALSIAVCDNHFILPIRENLRYIAIGSVTAEISMGQESAKKIGMVFEGFTPVFGGGEFAPVVEMPCKTQCSSSYTGSYSSSYSGSYIGSYRYHEYEFEYGSFSSSYSSSYSGSYVSSYSDPYGHIINPFILVNGYGIDLI